MAVAYPAFLVCCALGMVGLFTRPVAWAALLLGLYVLGVPQLYGKVDHYHYQIWFATLLAVSPCADALSVDAWRKRTAEPKGPARRYALPIRFAWLLMGVLYLFPGLDKAAIGLEWFSGARLEEVIGLIPLQQPDWTPLIDLGVLPGLYPLGATFAAVFEVGFLFLVVLPRARPFLAIAGVGFHLSTWATMGIAFWPLLAMYLTFVPWGELRHRFTRVQRQVGGGRPRRMSPVAWMGAGLLAANFAAGMALLISWPFTIFPRFARIAPVQQTVQLEIRTEDESRWLEPMRSPHWTDRGRHRLRWLLDQVVWSGEPERAAALQGVLAPEEPPCFRLWASRVRLVDGAVLQREPAIEHCPEGLAD